jgi:hypothetical protein
MQVTGTFPEGIISKDGKICTEFTLVEQTFRTTLEVAHDPDIDNSLLEDEVYYDACKYAKRLKVKGIAKVTPEMVLDLSGLDTAMLINKINALETQRANFRSAAQAAAEKGTGAPEAGAKQGRD